MFAVFARDESVGFAVVFDRFSGGVKANGAAGPGDDVAEMGEGGGVVPLFDFDFRGAAGFDAIEEVAGMRRVDGCAVVVVLVDQIVVAVEDAKAPLAASEMAELGNGLVAIDGDAVVTGFEAVGIPRRCSYG